MLITPEELGKMRGEDKIVPFELAPRIIWELARAGLKPVLVQGVYDLVHRGHVEYFRAGKALDPKRVVLIAALENDESVRKNKGSKRPVNQLVDRLHVVAEFLSVGLAFGYQDVPDYNRPDDFLARYRELGPAKILAAAWDEHVVYKRWQARQAGAELVEVNYQHVNSTTRMLRAVGYEE
jgi:cytidyltransferase-like protein